MLGDLPGRGQAARALSEPAFGSRDMATIPRSTGRKVDYPTSDGKPMAETDVHRTLMMDLIQTLQHRYAADPNVYVSGNLLLYYEEGNKRKHVSPDVFVVGGIEKRLRDYYLMWDEGKGPDLVIELTSKSTRSEDVNKKMALYRDVLQVPEYFLFDPFQDYLTPSMQGYRLVDGHYELIGSVARRLPSEVLGLHLERVGSQLRLFDPATGLRLPTSEERIEQERERAEVQRQQAEIERQRAEIERQQAEIQRQQAEIQRERADRAELDAEKLRQELEALRRQKNGG
jgi:Uma2 family endonuclease